MFEVSLTNRWKYKRERVDTFMFEVSLTNRWDIREEVDTFMFEVSLTIRRRYKRGSRYLYVWG